MLTRIILAAGISVVLAGCAQPYTGKCDANGYPFKSKERHSEVSCTEYCSVRYESFCRSTPPQLIVDVSKKTCSEMGFKPDTDGMANCVMNQQQQYFSAQQEAQCAKELKAEADRQYWERYSAEQARQREERNRANMQLYQPRLNQPAQQAQPAQQMQQLKQTDYYCMQTCQQSGYQYGLCQSKCSY